MTIVMTGGTSGIGRVAAERMLRDGADLAIGARSAASVTGAAMRPVDLASLASVRDFAAGLSHVAIDALVLNAGGQQVNVAGRSAEGFELTFATNHLAHYLLARLLLDRIVDGGRIVLTTSGTHDPAEKTGIPPPRHADAMRLAHPDADADRDRSAMVAGMRAYSASKLCNLMTARSLAALPAISERRIAVHAYDPGLTPGTGLIRAAPWPVRTLVWPLLPLVRPFAKGMNSLEDAGDALAGLAQGRINGDSVYMALRRGQPTWPEPSLIARDDDACAKLWRDSATLAGMTA